MKVKHKYEFVNVISLYANSKKFGVFATPETLIGLHPDAGASFHLSREFLGLTGSRLNGAEMIACGLATHYSHSQNVIAIEESLNNLITNDPCVIESCIRNFSDLSHLDKNNVFRRMKTINKCFSLATIEEIIEALEREAAKTHDPWCYSMLKNLKNASPLSLKVSLRSVSIRTYKLNYIIFLVYVLCICMIITLTSC
ncbi:putative 3-hydroxyisobutyryl-CoA hydrolase [Helianthus anomalus]